MTNHELIITLLAIFICMVISAFFSGTETSLTAVSRARIYRLIMEENKRAKMVGKLRQNKEALIGALMVGNNLVNILGSSLATAAALTLWGENGVFYSTIIMTVLIVIFSEVIPKTYAIQNAERVALAMAPLITPFVKLVSPVTYGLQAFIRVFFKLFGIDITKSGNIFSTTEVIRGTIELHHREGDMVKQDRDMLGSILDLGEIEVSQIMIHRKNMETIDADLPPEDIVRQALNLGHSRIPLWKDNQDNIIGILHVKNLFKYLHNPQVTLSNALILRIASKPWFIPDTTALKDQLFAFRERRQHFSLVVDEYGALLGCVTLEDIIEEIVGEIGDEHDVIETSGIIPLKDDTFLVEGSVSIRDLNRELDWNLPDDNASTIAGLVIHEARLIPEIGATFEFLGYRFTVENKQANQITRLRICKLQPMTLPGEDTVA